MALSGTKALEAWAKKVTKDYNNVNILNMTTSWRNGLGFCAIIHHHYPHLIDYDSLDPDDVFGNNSLAFNVAEQQLGIPALLDPRDMVECELLDRLSILTYLSQYFQVLNSPVKNISATSSPVKIQNVERAVKTNRENSENCIICDKPMFILERLNVGGKLFHRTCFKCARCEEQLTLASFYETETGQFCCEVCPDEEDNERKRTLKARKDLAKLMAAENETDEDKESNCDSISIHSNLSNNVNNNLQVNEDEEEKYFDEVRNTDNVEKSDVIDACHVSVDDELKDEEGIKEVHEDKEDIIVAKVEDMDATKEKNIVDDNNSAAQCEIKVEEVTYLENSNPFGDDEDDDVNQDPSRDEVNCNVVVNKETSANPFGSDFESENEENSEDSKLQELQSNSVTNNLQVSQNPFGDDFSSDEDTKTPCPASPSPSVTLRRKKRQAPKPPSLVVTPVAAPRNSLNAQNPKSRKDADNIHRKNELLNRSSMSSTSELSPMPQDKADEGQWRRKKGPAPPRPLPPKRSVKKLPRKAINQELFDIEVKQVGLERQGVKLEKSIREICATNDAKEGADRDSLGPEAEDLIIQLFDLVNEKNELFRRQTELIYMKKENRLEEIHADLEYQIRVLMAKPECQRTDDDKMKEEKLIAKLVEVVSQRNFIVDCLEMDRRRELDEDTAIEDHMSSYAAVQPEEKHQIALVKLLKRRKKKKKNKDDEKDVDTSEMKGHEDQEKQTKKSAKKKILSMTTKKLNSLNLTLKKQ